MISNFYEYIVANLGDGALHRTRDVKAIISPFCRRNFKAAEANILLLLCLIVDSPYTLLQFRILDMKMVIFLLEKQNSSQRFATVGHETEQTIIVLYLRDD